MSNHKPLPPTKDGWRYYWGEDDEPLCTKYIRELNQLEVNKRAYNQPTFIKRKIISHNVRLSDNDRAPQLKLNDDNSRVTGEKGYSMVRATHGINRGKFYYEVTINSKPSNSAARIGWGQLYSNLQAPLGYDHYGYSWRSRFGTKFHQAKGMSFDKNGGYGEGDVIGCMIELPFQNSKNHTQGHHLPPSVKAVCLVVPAKKKDLGTRTLEEKDEPTPLSACKTLPGSRISFYKNGQLVGVAFEDIFDGFYYPTISLYKNCIVTVNFGPKFKYPPHKYNDSSKVHIGYRPANDMAEISILDNFLADMLYVVDAENQLDGSNKLEEDTKKFMQG